MLNAIIGNASKSIAYIMTEWNFTMHVMMGLIVCLGCSPGVGLWGCGVGVVT